MFKNCSYFLVILNCFVLVNSLKILGLFPHPGKSHVDVFLPLMKNLAKKGHEITVVSHFPLKTPIPRYKDVYLDTVSPYVELLDMATYTGARIQKYGTPIWLNYFAKTACSENMKSKNLLDFLKSDQNFDLVIVELFNSDCFLGIANKFNAPVIGLSSCTIMPWTGERFAIPTHPAYIPSNLMDYSDRLSFFERVENTLVGIWYQLYFNLVMRRNDQEFTTRNFGDNLPSVRDMAFNISLMLVNTHFSLNLPRPFVPAIVEVGGIHIEKPKKLPEDLEKWINDSTEGVIYFSLGSMIKGHTFPDEKRLEFLKAFGRLPQRVLWKWENDTMPGKPDNVMIQKWMPQLDILCHPNVKAFISHGGLLGTTEAVHCGVPVVVMPQYGDQHTNGRALEANGGGVILNLHKTNEEEIYNTLKTVLSPRFRKSALELSSRFRDRPLPPLETAIYWVEYVARHRGAHHMRTAAVDMPLYKYFLLDVIVFLLAIFAVSTVIFLRIAKAVFRKLFDKKEKVKKN